MASKPYPIRNGGMPRYTEGSPEEELMFDVQDPHFTIMGVSMKDLMYEMGLTGGLTAADIPDMDQIALRYTINGRSTTKKIDLRLLAGSRYPKQVLRANLQAMHEDVIAPPQWEYHQPNQRPNVREEALQEYLVSVDVANAEGWALNADALDALRYSGVAAGIYQEQVRASRSSGGAPWDIPIETTHKPFRFSQRMGFAPSEVFIDESVWRYETPAIEPEPDGPLTWVCHKCHHAVVSDAEPEECPSCGGSEFKIQEESK